MRSSQLLDPREIGSDPLARRDAFEQVNLLDGPVMMIDLGHHTTHVGLSQ